jgi:hypothetical protein
MTRRDLFKTFAGAFAGVVAGAATVKATPTREEKRGVPGLGVTAREFLTGQQLALLYCRSSEIELIGPRGCGKTWALARWLADPADDPKYRGLFVCRNRFQVEYITDMLRMVRSKDFGELKYRPSEQCIVWPSGARVHLGQGDLDRFRGQEYQRAAFDSVLPGAQCGPLLYKINSRVRIHRIAAVQDYMQPRLYDAETTIHWHGIDAAYGYQAARFGRYDPDGGDMGLGGPKSIIWRSPNPPPDALLPCMRPEFLFPSDASIACGQIDGPHYSGNPPRFRY